MIDTNALKAQVGIGEVLAHLGIAYPTGQRTSKIRCPLPNHEDRTPSCAIYHHADSFYCFGCNRGGDTIALVQYVSGFSFVEAVEWIAQWTDAPIEYAESPESLPERLVSPVGAQAHTDVVAWTRAIEELPVEVVEAIFAPYDEIMRAYGAFEINAKETIKRLLNWRSNWKRQLT